MAGASRRRINAITSVAWASCLGMVSVVALAVVEHDLLAAAYAGGFVMALGYVGMVLLSGRRAGMATLGAGVVLGTAGVWLGPVQNYLRPVVVDTATRIGIAETFAEAYVALPAAAVASALLVGLLLYAGAGCGRIGFQSVLAGTVAGVCLIAPGEAAVRIPASGLLWGLIVLLSVATWARDHALRLSEASTFVRLGQEGPLATLARGSTQSPGATPP
ncbi:MAG: hypothetical protein KJZ65_04975 [Phycisphaerales bacterium]|nr:hypothetical protein [Phycisphaerales bacterium]